MSCRCSPSLSPWVTNSWNPPDSSMVEIPPYPAPVSAQALATTSSRTVLTSRLSLMRRLASLNMESRSFSASFSAFNPLVSAISSSLSLSFRITGPQAPLSRQPPDRFLVQNLNIYRIYTVTPLKIIICS